MSNPLYGIISLLKVFLPAFLFFMVVGAVAGFNSREHTVQRILLEDLVVKQEMGNYKFEYRCEKNKATYIYSVDDDKGKYEASLSTLLALQKTSLELPDDRLDEYHSIISALLGGVAGGANLKSLLKKPTTGWSWSHLKKTIIGIIGSITGYFTGYQIGVNYDTDCDSGLFTQAIRDPEIWTGIERTQLSVKHLTLVNLPGAALSPSGKAIYTWDEDPAFMCSSQLKKAKQLLSVMVNEDIENPTSQHFEMLDRIALLHAKITGTTEYKSLSELQVSKHGKHLDKYENSGSSFGDGVKRKRLTWDQACQGLAALDL